jgi:cytochrome c oxidase assembly factor CtaG
VLATTASAPGGAWGALLTTWRTTWAVEVVLTALAALYLRTVVHIGAWPVIRMVSAMGALVVAVVTVDSGIGILAPTSFPVGVVMQLLLTTVVPALWVAGRPGELLRRGASARTVAAVDQLRDGLPGRILACPPTGPVLYTLVLALTRLTAFPVAVATSPVLRVVGPLLWLVAGLVLFHRTPGSTRASPTGRFLVLLAATAVTVAAGGVLRAWPEKLLPAFGSDEVRQGGTILAAAGGGLMLVIAAAVGVRAFRDGGR